MLLVLPKSDLFPIRSNPSGCYIHQYSRGLTPALMTISRLLIRKQECKFDFAKSWTIFFFLSSDNFKLYSINWNYLPSNLNNFVPLQIAKAETKYGKVNFIFLIRVVKKLYWKIEMVLTLFSVNIYTIFVHAKMQTV